MTEKEARKLAQREIDRCKSTNTFSSYEIEQFYHSLPQKINIAQTESVILQEFTTFFMIKYSPLYKALKEK